MQGAKRCVESRGSPRHPLPTSPTSGAALAHADGRLQAAFLGQQVRQVVEDSGQVQHVAVGAVPGLQPGVFWGGAQGSGRGQGGWVAAEGLTRPPLTCQAAPGTVALAVPQRLPL